MNSATKALSGLGLSKTCKTIGTDREELILCIGAPSVPIMAALSLETAHCAGEP